MQCLRCEIYKNLEEYPTRNNIGYCRKCSARLSEKKYKMSEKGKIVEKRSSKKRRENNYFRDYYKKNEKFREHCRSYIKAWRLKNPEKVKAQLKRTSAKHRDKYLARQDLRRAVLRGKIIKPKLCQVCNIQNKRLKGHHTDYSKRLEVIWMCAECHKIQHGKL